MVYTLGFYPLMRGCLGFWGQVIIALEANSLLYALLGFLVASKPSNYCNTQIQMGCVSQRIFTLN
jgi:hypothetical protein